MTFHERQGAMARLNMLNQGWREILPTDEVRSLATRLLDVHDLRAADSVQLAAALIWWQQRPVKRPFVCEDLRLSKAAVGGWLFCSSAFIAVRVPAVSHNEKS
jgi:hypothetical protein